MNKPGYYIELVPNGKDEEGNDIFQEVTRNVTIVHYGVYYEIVSPALVLPYTIAIIEDEDGNVSYFDLRPDAPVKLFVKKD